MHKIVFDNKNNEQLSRETFFFFFEKNNNDRVTKTFHKYRDSFFLNF